MHKDTQNLLSLIELKEIRPVDQTYGQVTENHRSLFVGHEDVLLLNYLV